MQTKPCVIATTLASPHTQPSLGLPPVSVFNWHYTQCIIKKSATTDYWAFNIHHFVQPFHTRDDNKDDESGRNFDDDRIITDLPYPSYLGDLSELREHQGLEAIEHHRPIVGWNSGVSVSQK